MYILDSNVYSHAYPIGMGSGIPLRLDTLSICAIGGPMTRRALPASGSRNGASQTVEAERDDNFILLSQQEGTRFQLCQGTFE